MYQISKDNFGIIPNGLGVQLYWWVQEANMSYQLCSFLKLQTSYAVFVSSFAFPKLVVPA